MTDGDPLHVTRSRDILNVIRDAERICLEVNGLYDIFSSTLINMAEQDFAIRKDDGGYDEINDDSDWICLAHSMDMDVEQKSQGRGRRRYLGCLTFMADLGAPRGLARSIGYSVVQIGWLPKDGGSLEIRDMTLDQFHPKDDLPQLAVNSADEDVCLSQRRWWFAVPLAAIENPTAIEANLVLPTIALLKDGPRHPEILSGTSALDLDKSPA